jgi:DNA-binding transcriptional regulator YdaS (Cro superfamily)
MQTTLHKRLKMESKTGIELAVEKFDNSPSKLAQAMGGEILRQHVEHWLKAGKVPAGKAPDVMLATGISVDLLCPDTNWTAVRAMQVATMGRFNDI